MSDSAPTDAIPNLRLKKGSAKPLHSGHPWVFADALAKSSGPALEAGAEVRVLDEQGSCVGRGFYAPQSAVSVRMVTRCDEAITDLLIEARIDAALRLRREVLQLGRSDTNAYRLINSEGDGLPGLIVDVYGEYLALQIGTAGIERRISSILDVLDARLKPKGMLDRSDARMRKLEHLSPPKPEPLRGAAPTDSFFVRENGIELACDLRAGAGQKTGLFVDQRENRRLFGSFAVGRDVLDVFSYSGAFALNAARGGAKSLTLIESSDEALELARQNFERNKVDDADIINAPWPEGFRHLRQQKRQFDLIVLDPPKFARSREHLAQALSGYRDLNKETMRLLKPGGLLFTCSCSGTISETDFERAVAAGIRAGGRRGTVLERRSAGSDHPTPPGFEQGRYLKCLVICVD